MRYSRLSLESLEARIVPSGTIIATLSPTGVLSIIGDDDFNVVSLLVTSGDVTLTPNGDTAINAAATGAPVTLVGTVKSIKADLKGGGDDISIDGSAPFNLTGGVAIALGDGNNTLALNTTGVLKMASLTVTGGDGSDDVTVQGGATSAVTGAGKFTYLNGGSKTSLDNVDFGSVTLTAGSGAANDVILNNLTVAKTVSTALSNSNPAIVEITGSNIGGLKEAGYILSTTLLSSTVAGPVSIRGGFQADLQVDTAIINKNVAITAPNASMTASGGGSTFNGNLAITGTAYTETYFQSTSLPLTEVKGNLTVKGAWFADVFDANSNFKASKNVSLKLGDGDNEVSIGDGGSAVSILGNLSIQAGAGNDLINLDRLALTGAATIKLFGGADELSIENNAALAGAFSADMGSGDDTISVAQNTGTPGPVTFSGLAKILAGIGNDTLLLGLLGDTSSNAIFLNLLSSIDGGLGLNDFDDGTAQHTGVSTPNW